MLNRPKTQYSLEQAVGASPNLAALRERVRQSQRCMETIQPLLPPPLREQVLSGPLDGGNWCILTRNTSASTKLRQLLPTMLQVLQAQGMAVQQIRIKIQRVGP